MPRPKSANPKITKHIPIDPDLCAKAELALFSDLEGRVPYGAWSALIEQLLRQHFETTKRREGLAWQLSRLAVFAEDDPEGSHSEADKLLVTELEALGYDLDAFKVMEKWYA